MDKLLTQIINGIGGTNSALDWSMITITNYGVFALIFAVILLWWTPYARLATRHACVVSGIAFVASLAFNQFLLLFIHRIRPYDTGITHLLISPNADWSFPSDHATAVASIVAAFWFKKFQRIAGLLAVPAFLISFSRVFIGVHYVSDVLGGVAIGSLGAFFVTQLYQDDNRYVRLFTRIL